MSIEVEFPWRSSFLTPACLKAVFKKLSTKVHLLVKKYDELPSHFSNIIDKSVDKTYLKYGKYYKEFLLERKDKVHYSALTDYFVEPFRLKAFRYDSNNSKNNSGRKEFQKFLEKGKEKKKNRDNIRKNIKECTQFPPEIMICLIKMFRVKKIFDMCGGWGDRLIGSLAMDRYIKRYVCIEPNKNLISCYKDIVNFYSPFLQKDKRKKKVRKQDKYVFIQGGAENVDLDSLPEEKFDLIFKSIS